MAMPDITREEYIEYVEDFRKRAGGTAYEVVNGIVESTNLLRTEAWAIYFLANVVPDEWFDTTREQDGLEERVR